MDHAVQYRDATGEVQLTDVPSLDAALELVERLRNAQGVAEVRVLREVPIEIRTYYRVVAVDGDAPAAPAAPAAPSEDAAPASAPVEVVAGPAPPVEDEVEVDEAPNEVLPASAADPDEGEPVVSGTMIMSPPPTTGLSERRSRFGRG